MILAPSGFESKLLSNVFPITLVSVDSSPLVRILTPESVSGPVQIKDQMVRVTTGETSCTDYKLEVRTLGGVGSHTPQFSSLAESVASVDSAGNVTHVSEGSATIRTTLAGQTWDTALTFSITGGEVEHLEHMSFVPGSLAAHICSAVDSRLEGKTAATSLRIYSTQDHVNQLYVRNPYVWCADIPDLLTCISPWNSTGGPTRAGTLVSPRHIVFATHYQIAVGAVVRFVGHDGTVYNRTMTGKLTVTGTDITVGVLDSDLPIGFAKVMPDNWLNYLPYLEEYRQGRIPGVALDQEEKALVADLLVDTSFEVGSNYAIFSTPSSANRLAFHEQRIGGDSGNPGFLIINNTPVLITTWTGASGVSSSGPSIRAYKPQVNAAMASLGGDYQLTEVDLSAFPTF